MKITSGTHVSALPVNGWTSFLIALSLACLLSGCGGSGDLVKAGGKVTCDGKPLPGGTIKFYPTSGGRSANAVIGDDGTFVLSYKKQGDGLPPGEYSVAVVCSILKNRKKINPEDDQDGELFYDTSGKLINIVPPIYNDIRTSPLRQTITAEGGQQYLEIDIRAKR